MSGSRFRVEIERSRLERAARRIFGEDSAAVRRWADYWGESVERNRGLLDSFRPLTLIDFAGKRVLDVGCGTGGMAAVVEEKGASYTGLDFHRHVLELAPPIPGAEFLQASGTDLPFSDSSFDYIMAFDVVEHLVGGFPWQLKFFQELRRVLRPLGMIFLTTPNRYFPYEAHSGLYGPQYLPVSLADRYIAWRNPSFLREHHSFAEIQMMSPRQLRRALQNSGLAWLHDLPCGLDRGEYLRLFPARGVLAYLGLGWYPHAEFWGVLVRGESRQALRLKRPQQWYYLRNQPDSGPVPDFQPWLDFDIQGFGHQLARGWHWHERDQRGFRWTSLEATAVLQAAPNLDYLEIRGFTPGENRVEVLVEGWKVGERRLTPGKPFRLRYLLPFESVEDRVLEVTLRCRRRADSPDPQDQRELGVMVFSLGLAA